jgi:hypothetical protein
MERMLYYGQLVSVLRTQMFFGLNKACRTHFSASSVNIMCCVARERENMSFLLVVEQEVGNTEPHSKTPFSYRSN